MATVRSFTDEGKRHEESPSMLAMSVIAVPATVAADHAYRFLGSVGRHRRRCLIGLSNALYCMNTDHLRLPSYSL
jgi:hypothetical protein